MTNETMERNTTPLEGQQPMSSQATSTALCEELVKNQVFIEKGINGGIVRANIKTMKYTYAKPLLGFIGNSAMSLNLIFNSKISGVDSIGGIPTRFFKGWQTNFHQYCYQNGADYSYIDESGFMHTFQNVGGTTYCDNCGTGLKLKVMNNICTIYSGTNFQLVFTPEGRLHKLRVLNNVNWFETIVSYTATGQISRVTDPLGNYVDFSYTTTALESVTFVDSIGRTYSATGTNQMLNNLREGTSSGLVSDTFLYTGASGLLTEVADYNSNVVQITYPEISKLLIQLSTRKNGITTILEKDDIVNLGQAVQTTNIKGIVMRYSYDEHNECVSSCEKKHNECFGTAYVSNDHFSNYNYILSQTPCYWEYDESESWSLSPKSSRSHEFFFVDENNDKPHIFSMVINLPSTATGSYPMHIMIYDESNTLVEKSFAVNCNCDQIIIIPFDIEPSRDMLFVEIYNNSNIDIYCSDIKITEGLPTDTAEIAYCNQNTGELSFLDADNVRWYKLKTPHKLIIDNVPTTATLTMADYFANLFSFASKSTSRFDVWTNDKKSLIPDVPNLAYDFNLSGRHNVSALKLALRTERGDKKYLKTFEIEGDTIVIKNKNLNAPLLPADKLVINKQTGLTMYSLSSEGIKTSYTYDNDGNVTQEMLSKNNIPLDNIILDSAFENKRLKTETTYIGTQSNTTTINTSAAAVDSALDPLNQITSFTYNNYKDTLTKVGSSVGSVENANNINYTNKVPQSMAHNNVNYSFVYDKYNRISDIKIAGNPYCPSELNRYADYDVIESTYANNTYDGQTKREYDSYGRLRAVYLKTAAFGSYVEALLFIYASNQTIGHAATSPTASNLKQSASSLLYKVIDKYARTEHFYYYDLAGALSRVRTLSTTSYKATNLDKVLTKDSSNRLTKVEYSGILISEYSYPADSMGTSNVVNKTIATPNKSSQTLTNTTSLDSLNRLSKDEIQVNNHKLTTSYTYADRMSGSTKVGTTPYVKTFSANSSKSSSLNYSNSINYDKNSNITSIATTDGASTFNQNFTYDGLGRITMDNNQKLNARTTYTYDAGGNIMSKTKAGYNGIGSATTISYGYSATNKDLLTSYDGKAITYDACLNPTTYFGSTLFWQCGRLLTGIDSEDGESYSEFSYDGFGNRTFARRNSVECFSVRTFTLDGNRVVEEYFEVIDADSNERIFGPNYLTYIYTQSGLSGFSLDKKIYTYRKNILGDIVAILDDNHNIVAKYEYDAFGKHTVYGSSGAVDTNRGSIGNINPFRYRGYHYDIDTGLYYTPGRYYDPEVGRWLNADDISYLDPETIGGLNLFAYCGNNPIMRVDTTGNAWYEFWKWDWGKIGMVALSVVEVVGGIVCIATGVGGQAGMTLIGMGGGSLIGGFMNEHAGGSFFAGWAGGQISGLLTGIVPAIGAALGGFGSSIVTDLIDKGWSNINWGKAGWSAGLAMVLDLVPGIFASELGKSLYKMIPEQLFLSLRGIVVGLINGIFNSFYK